MLLKVSIFWVKAIYHIHYHNTSRWKSLNCQNTLKHVSSTLLSYLVNYSVCPGLMGSWQEFSACSSSEEFPRQQGQVTVGVEHGSRDCCSESEFVNLSTFSSAEAGSLWYNIYYILKTLEWNQTNIIYLLKCISMLLHLPKLLSLRSTKIRSVRFINSWLGIISMLKTKCKNVWNPQTKCILTVQKLYMYF